MIFGSPAFSNQLGTNHQKRLSRNDGIHPCIDTEYVKHNGLGKHSHLNFSFLGGWMGGTSESSCHVVLLPDERPLAMKMHTHTKQFESRNF